MQYYDFYLSVGPNCSPAIHLEKNALRYMASPLDWQRDYSLDTVIHLFSTSFEDFFVDIEEDRPKTEARNQRREKQGRTDFNRWIIDRKNHIVSIHHFPCDLPLDEAQRRFLATMKRRYHRLDRELKNAKKLALISARGDPAEKLQDFVSRFSSIYPNLEIMLLNVRQDNDMKQDDMLCRAYHLTDRLSILDYSRNNTERDLPEGVIAPVEYARWSKVLSEYRLTDEAGKQRKVKEMLATLGGGERPVVVYGAGLTGSRLIGYLRKFQIPVKGVTASWIREYKKTYEGLPVQSIENYPKDCNICIAIQDIEEAKNIQLCLKEQGYSRTYVYDYTDTALI